MTTLCPPRNETIETLSEVRSIQYQPLCLERDDKGILRKYAPQTDALIPEELVSETFLLLPKAFRSPSLKMCPVKSMLIKEFARNTLQAKRISDKYISTLGSILSSFATADKEGAELLVSQRSEQHGKPKTLRTIQTQMFNAGLLDKEIRAQGLGFVGAVFVYSPRSPFRCCKATAEATEEAYRASERDCLYHSAQLPTNLTPKDVPY